MGERTAPGRFLSQPLSRRLAQVLLVVLVVGPLALWAVPRYAAATYEHDVTLITGSSSARIASLNRDLMEFGGEPAEAQDLESRLGEASELLASVAETLDKVQPPEYASTYHSDLVGLYRDASAYAGELAGVMRFIVDRTRLLGEFAGSLDTFAKTLQTAQSAEEVLGGAASFQADAEASLEALIALERPEILTYSNQRLEGLLERLSAALATLQTAVRASDESGTVAAIAELQSVLSDDWGAGLAEADADGVQAYAARVEDLESRRRALQEFPNP